MSDDTIAPAPDPEPHEDRLLDPAPELPPIRGFLVVEPDGLVTQAGWSNLLPAGATPVDLPVAIEARGRLGACAWTDGALVDRAPPEPEPEPQPVRLLKVDIWRRVTDAEAEGLVQLLEQQPVRLQRMFNDATVLSSADEMWPILSGAIAQQLGAARAAVILAPST